MRGATLATIQPEHLYLAASSLLEEQERAVDLTPTFRGDNLRAQSITDHAWVLSGPAETGKTWAACWRLDELCRSTPRAKAALVRKVRADMAGTVLETWEKLIGLRGGVTAFGGRHPEFYEYDNGARVYVGGMDRPEKVLSGERDWIVCNQFEEFELEDFEHMKTRCTGRGCVTDTPMIFGDCNPGPPSHWIQEFAQAGSLKLLESRHEDNPTLWDGEAWTEQGKRTLSILDSLTGVRLARLRFGRWVAAEGVVYDGFDRRLHVIPRFEIPKDWRRIGAIDFGYTNPAVLQLWAIDPDGRMFLDREIYRSQTLVSDLAVEWKQLTEGLKLETVVADHDAEDRATLQRAGVVTRAAVKEVQAGIQKVASRLRKAGDGRPRLFLFEDAREQPDPEIAALHKPTSTAAEFESYVWTKTQDGRPVKEEPLKVNDHGMDALRYAVEYVDRARMPEIPHQQRIQATVDKRFDELRKRAEANLLPPPPVDMTDRHLAFEQARADEKKRIERPRFLPTSMGRLRRLR